MDIYEVAYIAAMNELALRQYPCAECKEIARGIAMEVRAATVETRSQEFERLLHEYETSAGSTKCEAWNLIADFAVENGSFIRDALKEYVRPHSDDIRKDEEA